jgi:hypothetical protein
MIKFATFGLCIFLCVTAANSGSRPTPSLKDVSVVEYHLAGPVKGRCAIDLEAWNTAIDFVANQSTKLKLIRKTDHEQRSQELLKKALEANEKYFTLALRSDAEMAAAKKAREEANEIHDRYFAAPSLLLVADTFEHSGGLCVGDVSATVRAMLKQSEMIATGQVIPHPFEEIWSTSTLLAGPPTQFSRFVIETSEQMMKSFVNDWARSQEF